MNAVTLEQIYSLAMEPMEKFRLKLMITTDDEFRKTLKEFELIGLIKIKLVQGMAFGFLTDQGEEFYNQNPTAVLAKENYVEHQFEELFEI